MSPCDRRTLEHGALLLRQTIDAARDQHLERRRQRTGLFLCCERDELLEEQRVALGGVDSCRDGRLVERGRLRQRGHELLRLGRRHRLEEDRVLTPRRPRLEELRPRDAEDEERPGRPADEVLDEVEERRRGPVDVLEDDHDRAARRPRLEHAPQRPERLTRLGERPFAQPRADPFRVRLVCEQRLERAELLEDLLQRSQRRARRRTQDSGR